MSTLEGSHLSTPSYSATRVVHLQQLLKAESPNTMGKNWSPSTNKASVLEQRTFLGLWRGSGGDTERKKESHHSSVCTITFTVCDMKLISILWYMVLINVPKYYLCPKYEVLNRIVPKILCAEIQVCRLAVTPFPLGSSRSGQKRRAKSQENLGKFSSAKRANVANLQKSSRNSDAIFQR